MDVSVFFPTFPSLCVCCSHAVCACCAQHHPAFLAVHTGSGGAGVFMSISCSSSSVFPESPYSHVSGQILLLLLAGAASFVSGSVFSL